MFLYVGLYFISRFIVEILRDVPILIGPFSITHLASVLLVIGAFVCTRILSSEPVEEQSPASQR